MLREMESLAAATDGMTENEGNGKEGYFMSGTLQILITVLSGVTIFVVGQLLERCFVTPIQEIRRTKGKIAHALTYYANFISLTPCGGTMIGKTPEEMKAAVLELRDLASQLRATFEMIPCRGPLALLGWIPTRTGVEVASQELIGWSNSLGQPELREHRKRIAEALRIGIA